MNELKIGDRVQWQSRSGEIRFGTVDHINHTSDGPLVTIWGDNQKWHIKPIEGLAHTDNTPAPVDEHSDMLAVHDSPFRLLAEDYELMTGQAGNLGGVELL